MSSKQRTTIGAMALLLALPALAQGPGWTATSTVVRLVTTADGGINSAGSGVVMVMVIASDSRSIPQLIDMEDPLAQVPHVDMQAGSEGKDAESPWIGLQGTPRTAEGIYVGQIKARIERYPNVR